MFQSVLKLFAKCSQSVIEVFLVVFANYCENALKMFSKAAQQ